MQVKKFEAASVLEALQEVKKVLGPDAIVLSTQEMKRSVIGAKKFLVVAAITETQMKKKELAEQKLGRVFDEKVQSQSARSQKMFIENVYNNLERQHKQRTREITKTRYIDIEEEGKVIEPPPVAASVSVVAQPPFVKEDPISIGDASGSKRVKEAVKNAFQSSLGSEFFNDEEEEKVEEVSKVISFEEKKKEMRTPAAIAEIIQRLKSSGVETETCNSLVPLVMGELGSSSERKALVDSWFAKWILNRVQVCSSQATTATEVFVGPHGAGKTAALVKLATHYRVNENKSIAIITTDLNRVGAVEQLRVYSRILNAPVYVAKDMTEVEQKINELTVDKVLVDTPGISLSNMEELDFMRGVAHMNLSQGKQVHLVISALTKAKDLGGLLKRFRVSQFNDLIVTNIDQTTQHGILLNIQEKIKMPFHSFGIGSDIVDGFEYASKERVLDLIFKLTKPIGEAANERRI